MSSMTSVVASSY